MAVEFSVKSTRTTEDRFFPEQLLVLAEMNGRHELPDVQPIVDSILKFGQLQPVTIRASDGRRPTLVAGFSRYRAIAYINENKLYSKKPLQLRCAYTALTETQAFLANIEENRVRNATTPMDDAYNIQRLINVYQMSESEVSEAYRQSLSWVKSRLSLLQLTPEAEKAVREGRAAGPAAREIAKLSGTLQRKAAQIEGKISVADVKAIAGKSTPKPVKDAGLLKLVKAALDDVRGILTDKSLDFIEIDRRLLLAIANYIDGK